MTRREARELAFALVFEWGFGGGTVDELLAGATEARQVEADGFALELAHGVEARAAELDGVIGTHALRWRRERISRVAMAIMRVAVLEMLHVDGVPVSVAINEAVELAKTYGGEEDAQFVNGVLGGIARAEE